MARLRNLGFAVLSSESLDAGACLVRGADPPIGAVLLPSPLPLREPEQALRLLAEVSPTGSFRFVVLGEALEAGTRSALQQAGLGLALFEPFTEAELRFVVNHVLYNPTQGEGRRASGSVRDIELPLPAGLLCTEAQVLDTNVPGSAYRRHTPKGMSVRFGAMPPEQRDRLERFVETRARSFQL